MPVRGRDGKLEIERSIWMGKEDIGEKIRKKSWHIINGIENLE